MRAASLHRRGRAPAGSARRPMPVMNLALWQMAVAHQPLAAGRLVGVPTLGLPARTLDAGPRCGARRTETEAGFQA